VTAIEDDVVAAGGAVPLRPRNVKDRMRADLAARKREQQRTVVIVPTADRPCSSLQVTFRVPNDGVELADLSSRADKKAGKNGPAGVWFNRMLLARYCESVAYDDEPLADEHGNPWTFAHPEMIEFYQATSAGDCVFHAYGSDADVAAVAQRLLAAGGFGDSDSTEVIEDPTSAD